MRTLSKIIVAFMLLATNAWAKPILTVTCEEPIGVRFDLKKGKVTTSPDGFSGVNPVFVIDKDKPGKLLVVWAPAKVGGMELPANAREADIVSATANQITALEIDPTGDAVLMFSLYPQAGVVYFTQHRYLLLEGGDPNSANYHAKCSFSMKK